MRAAAIAVLAAGCAAPLPADREQRVIDALADDNYVWARRDPGLVELKLKKLQRGAYEWLRGTASLYWRDLTELGARDTSGFSSDAASRVLLVGDPHPENVGTFRASDGTMVIDWNDLDAAGYGPFTADVGRLAIGMLIAIGATDDAELVTRIANGYTTELAAIAAGAAPLQLGLGAHAALLDKELGKAKSRGERLFAVEELAPVTAGTRYIAFGDLEAIAPDGPYEDTVVPVGAEAAELLDAAVAQWAARRGQPATVKLRARRIGSGVASYAALRYNVILEGPTAAPADDEILELKEERDGLVLHGVPQRDAGEWASPGARVADAQRRLHGRRDADPRLGYADLGGLSFKIRDREAFQRGLDHLDIADLKRAELLALADLLGRLLARSHGAALTADGVSGWTVIEPVLAGREAAFATELVATARSGAEQVIADHAMFAAEDLAALVVPR